ncbi:UDP-2,4-diacetamido-2,4,6-trideoxy-beta-L-altropyranose hydrolase [Caldalkalibacillus thermarum]|uniref:UDP-2,4-diacetamido-2,4, 6-trideoxy-beta-L-altropyranose hydrolase n=1 Tax=Caldalkalibacillus thermarum TaxID=296745 RepID=UPI00166A20D3|nr:UDP-2,4-diacetamido-2,4,6-trideoxy-beta-L-altropyranose hydrolase [Caldalkalibacillus thermarum]
MNIAIRVDASLEMGTGHVMRCLTLAELLRNKGASLYFICRLLKGNLVEIIQAKGFKVYTLPKPSQHQIVKKLNNHSHWLGVDWRVDADETLEAIQKSKKKMDILISDHYALQKEWEQYLRPIVKKIMVIDDLADRPHDCDYLLDQNYYQNMFIRYKNLIPPQCKVFLGPKYALLRKEFLQEAKQLRKRDGSIKRILIFFGGSDYHNMTEKALRALLKLKKKDIVIDIVVGQNYLYHQKLKELCFKFKFINYHRQVNNIAQLMNMADLCIGAGGITTWERCYMGLPTILISVAKNQELIAQNLSQAKAVMYLGSYLNVTQEKILKTVLYLIKNPQEVKELSKRSKEIIGNERNGLDMLSDILLNEREIAKKE